MKKTSITLMNIVFITILLSSTHFVGITASSIEYDPWVEIFNPGPDDVDLAGMRLTNDPTDPDRWTFPTLLLPAGDHVIVWCDNQAGDPGLHTNFDIGVTAGYIGLFGTLGSCHDPTDELTYLGMDRDRSYGRYCDGSSVWDYFTSPTPEATNTG